MLTIAYFTNRLNPHIEWFLDSLARQLNGDEVELIVVDFHKDEGRKPVPPLGNVSITHVAPKPNIWQGPHRLTQGNWFNAANARNTAICMAKGSHIAFVDDLSVLMPDWMHCVRQSIQENYIALGAYKKVKQLVVENGQVKSFEDYPQGTDTRLGWATQDQMSCGGNILYGYACMPLEAALTVNGFPEDLCGGLGFEDVCFGTALGNTKQFSFRYDRRMMAYESEEDHFVDKPFRKTDKGVSPRDKSHAALNIAESSTRFPNQFNLREMREAVQRGEPFPIPKSPLNDWFDGQLISEMV